MSESSESPPVTVARRPSGAKGCAGRDLRLVAAVLCLAVLATVVGLVFSMRPNDPEEYWRAAQEGSRRGESAMRRNKSTF